MSPASELDRMKAQLVRDHRNHGCDTWDQHMADCDWLVSVAEQATRLSDGLGYASATGPAAEPLLELRALLDGPVVVHGHPASGRDWECAKCGQPTDLPLGRRHDCEAARAS